MIDSRINLIDDQRVVPEINRIHICTKPQIMNTIERLIQQGKIDQAFSLLTSPSSSSTSRRTLISLQSEWNQNEHSRRLGIIDYGQYNKIANRIKMSLIEINSGSQTGKPTTPSSLVNMGPSDFSTKINALQSLQKKVRFGFSLSLKANLNELLEEYLKYESQKRREELFDLNESEIEKLNERYDAFLEAHERELRTKQTIKVGKLKKQLNDLEQDLTISTIRSLIDNLIAFDIKYTHWQDIADSLNENNLENFAFQLAEIIDAL